MPHATLTIETDDRKIASLRSLLDKSDKRAALRAWEQFIHDIQTGTRTRAMVRACIASVAASETITCTFASVVDGTDLITVAGTELAVEATVVDQGDFDGGTTDATCAANMAAAINANTTINKLCRATSAAGVCTVTSIYPGPVGKLIALTETGNGFVLGSANLALGASDEVDSYQMGFTPSV